MKDDQRNRCIGVSFPFRVFLNLFRPEASPEDRILGSKLLVSLREFTMGRQRRQAETRFIPNDFFPRANLSNDDLSQTSTRKEPL
jgi:hypothetical protein